jgi:NAD(P)-dependent dehydrogenase (short-subunit alcohol dehydrogenase family)
MKEFSGKVAVITGAASGIGLGIADRCAREDMKVVLADVEESALAKTEKALRAKGTKVLSVLTDVSKVSDVETLAKKTLDTFGEVHLLVNNAGVVAGSTIWESTPFDWEWVMGVNLWGVIYGLRSFVPIMLRQDTEAHIINTASATGLVSYSLSAPYQVAKHGVVSLSEHLYYSLQQQNAKVNVSVLCSGWVKTRVLNSGRNRPLELRNATRKKPSGRESFALHVKKVRQAVQDGMSPNEVADQVFNAIENEQFYILTHLAETTPLVRQRMEDILSHRNPPQADIDDFLFLKD